MQLSTSISLMYIVIIIGFVLSFSIIAFAVIKALIAYKNVNKKD